MLKTLGSNCRNFALINKKKSNFFCQFMVKKLNYQLTNNIYVLLIIKQLKMNASENLKTGKKYRKFSHDNYNWKSFDKDLNIFYFLLL